mmetsp:Transcript_35903/g.101015  ORF Transcript_35903/g.101015 Transcript_35903/m.101015 type:complete len:360 (+) Transcript_35903:676-1755(+)
MEWAWPWSGGCLLLAHFQHPHVRSTGTGRSPSAAVLRLAPPRQPRARLPVGDAGEGLQVLLCGLRAHEPCLLPSQEHTGAYALYREPSPRGIAAQGPAAVRVDALPAGRHPRRARGGGGATRMPVRNGVYLLWRDGESLVLSSREGTRVHVLVPQQEAERQHLNLLVCQELECGGEHRLPQLGFHAAVPPDESVLLVQLRQDVNGARIRYSFLPLGVSGRLAGRHPQTALRNLERERADRGHHLGNGPHDEELQRRDLVPARHHSSSHDLAKTIVHYKVDCGIADQYQRGTGPIPQGADALLIGDPDEPVKNTVVGLGVSDLALGRLTSLAGLYHQAGSHHPEWRRGENVDDTGDRCDY